MNEFFATAKEEIGQGRGATPTQQATNGQSNLKSKYGLK
jgi:hypothetical protein